MLADPFRESIDSPTAPAQNCFPIIPSDSADLLTATKALYIGQGGDLNVVLVNATTAVVFRNVSTGTILDIRAKAVRATGTSASDIVGLA